MMRKTYRRFGSEFQRQLVEAYLAGEGSLKGIANGAGIDHSLLHYWLRQYHASELSLDLVREESMAEAAQQIAALERKVGQLTMELDLLKRGLIAVPAMNNARSSIISGPVASASASSEDAG